MEDLFIIPLNGLPIGVSTYNWHADDKFFQSFGNEDINFADINVDVKLEKSGSYLGIDCYIEGELGLLCDRCMSDLYYPIDEEVLLSLKFTEDPQNIEENMDGDREIVYLSSSDLNIDLRQIIYDYIILSLPIKRVHEEGECDKEALKYLNTSNKDKKIEVSENNPFAVLKDFLNKE